MEGRERAACEARLQALRSIQTLLDAASLQFQQYLATAPPINLNQPESSSSATRSANAPNTQFPTNEPGPSFNNQPNAGEAQNVDEI